MSAPDHGFILGHQETDGHDLHTVIFQRLHGLAILALGTPLDAHHHRHAGAVDVGIQQAHAGPLGRQRQRQIDSCGALAHAALARGHGHDVLHPRQQLHAALHRVGRDLRRDVDRHVGHALDSPGGRHQRLAKRRDLALGRIAQLNVESHVRAGDFHVLQGLARDEIHARVRVRHILQRFGQRLYCYRHCTLLLGR
jgi:hypothetical protein